MIPRKKIILVVAVVFFLAMFSSLSQAEIIVKRTPDGEVDSASTNTKGIGLKLEPQYQKSPDGRTRRLVGKGGKFEIKIDLSMVTRAENLRKKERSAESKLPDYYNLTFTYSTDPFFNDRGDKPYGRSFLADGINVEIYLDDNPIELVKLEQKGNNVGLWFEVFRITEKELAAIVRAAKMDFKVSNNRGQSIGWHVREKDLDELKEFCIKYAGIKAELKPSLHRNETVKIIGLPGEGAIPLRKN